MERPAWGNQAGEVSDIFEIPLKTHFYRRDYSDFIWVSTFVFSLNPCFIIYLVLHYWIGSIFIFYPLILVYFAALW